MSNRLRTLLAVKRAALLPQRDVPSLLAALVSDHYDPLCATQRLSGIASPGKATHPLLIRPKNSLTPHPSKPNTIELPNFTPQNAVPGAAGHAQPCPTAGKRAEDLT